MVVIFSMNGKRWIAEEECTLCTNWGKISLSELQDLLQLRSKASIRMKAIRLGLPRLASTMTNSEKEVVRCVELKEYPPAKYARRFSDEEKQIIDANLSRPAPYIIALLPYKRSPQSVTRYRRRVLHGSSCLLDKEFLPRVRRKSRKIIA